MVKTLALIGAGVLIATWGCAQPVLDYVNAPDDSYAWEVVEEQPVGETSIVHLQVTSQTWRGIVWTHRVQVIVPAHMQHPETALLLITGGSPGTDELALLGMAAVGLSAPMVVLGDIPNQPLFGDLREDALIAYTFAQFLESGEADWPLLFPMTKAAVRTMDAIEQYTQGAWETPVSGFITTGGSKRGWTTWFTGAVVPERLKGIVPMVSDNLNLAAQMPHQVATWGDYSAMIHDYTERGLP
ncbi:MAG: PhoPQ-activated protein PqaA family protein, partial [Armatimonadota bacterium]